MKILVVGAGSAGLISALILNKFLNAQVDVVFSEKIDIVGVGEGSTEHFKEFIDFVGIDWTELVKESDATFKAGIMFENWTPKPYFHNVGNPFGQHVGQYPYIYANQVSDSSDYVNNKITWNNTIPSEFLNVTSPFNQFHFNTYKLNSFLKSVCEKNGVGVHEDKIVDVCFNESGDIDYLTGEKMIYDYDFYIDSTGQRKMLIGQMGARWVSFGQYLRMKSAIVFPTPEEEEYNMWTLAKAMDYGWRFKIPTWGKIGNGYIFDSDYITKDQAKEELDKEFGFDVQIAKEFNFDPGHLDSVWIRNCVAVGLSAAFVEPLEATAIGSTIQQSFLLMHKIMNYSQMDIDSYNNSFRLIMENIRDFIALHYVVGKDNTDFWRDNQMLELPETLAEKMLMWRHRMPIREDFINQSSYSMFWENNFTVVLHGLGLFDSSQIKEELKMLNSARQKEAQKIILDAQEHEDTRRLIKHKDFIRITREYL